MRIRPNAPRAIAGIPSRTTIYVAAVAAPPLLRGLGAAAPFTYLLLAGAVGLVLAGVARMDPPVARRLYWRRWGRDIARAAAVLVTLTTLWIVRDETGTATAWFALRGASLFAGAVVEEGIYRGILPGVLDLRSATVASSIAFAAAHLSFPFAPGSALTFLFHLAAGFAFAALRGAGGGLVGPILAHTAYDGAAILRSA